MLTVIKSYEAFNERRYGNPWVARVTKDAKIDFSEKIGGYTGGYQKGEAGDLYINAPRDGEIYAYGQKDYRKTRSSELEYAIYVNGMFEDLDKGNLVCAINESSFYNPVTGDRTMNEKNYDYVRLFVNFENNAEEWWDKGGHHLWHLVGGDGKDYVFVHRELAKKFEGFASEIPGWEAGDNAPILSYDVDESDLEELKKINDKLD